MSFLQSAILLCIRCGATGSSKNAPKGYYPWATAGAVVCCCDHTVTFRALVLEAVVPSFRGESGPSVRIKISSSQ